jgi:hypothetical protein
MAKRIARDRRPVISLETPHTRCPRCRVWARRDPCPHCGSRKERGAGKPADRPLAAAAL